MSVSNIIYAQYHYAMKALGKKSCVVMIVKITKFLHIKCID